MHGYALGPVLEPAPESELPEAFPSASIPLLQPALYAGPVGIRRFSETDVPHLFRAVRESLDDLLSWMIWCRSDYSMELSAKFVSECDANWSKGEQYSFAIIDRANGGFLGSVGLSSISRTHRVANLGYWVRSQRTRHGVATAATRLAARFALGTLRLNRLELLVPPANLASQRVAEKAGAKREGVLRQRLMLRGRPHDALLYSLVARDLEG